MTLIIFDGFCNLCEQSVNFILRHESQPQLMFVPLQTSAGTRLLREHGFDPEDAKTFVLIENNKVYVRSTAAIRVARYLRWPWRAIMAMWIIPRPLRDIAYNYVAANRYRWCGRKETCMAPTPDVMRRFLQD